MRNLWPSQQRRRKRNWMRSQPRGRRGERFRMRLQERRKPSFISKTCMTTRADLTSISHRMWVSVFGLQMLQISVICPRNSFMFGLDTLRGSVESGYFPSLVTCCSPAPWTVKSSCGRFTKKEDAYGHLSATAKQVRDICFNNTGSQFLSAAYDRYLKLWDSETGKCISHFTNRKVPYCVKFNPDEDKQNLFVAGMSDKKIVQWDIRTGEVVQEYDRHLGAVNTITFVDENRRFVSTSDDKSLRVWEWDIPVDFKYIAEPSMHSMPAVTLSPNSKWLACQSMDNQILIFGAQNRFRLNKKKIFKGHMVAGYACQVDFSPDMSYVVSGDADGKLNIWDWKTTKLYHRIKAHDKVCISALWHPHETSKVITCGWDGQIKLWD
ncbi:hypothetical protein fugu_017454 [Takifugu bimaculatus]|uniref:Pre-mRNA-processing factor 17 n=1 Tax=Takifugu bimaculatus TaxID=433685 RepID=A0A4Z2BR07_9TELE|nr:hypothetical protein fugu_017454 [Takifugu bimaculatus]